MDDTTEPPAHLGAHLRRLRSRASLTVPQVVEQFAAASHRQTVYTWESGRCRIEPSTLELLLKLYRASEADVALARELRGRPLQSAAA